MTERRVDKEWLDEYDRVRTIGNGKEQDWNGIHFDLLKYDWPAKHLTKLIGGAE